MSPIDLSQVSTEDLLVALDERNDVVVSAWNINDITSFIESDESIEVELSEEEIKAAALVLLLEKKEALRDILGARGNDFYGDAWSVEGEGIIEDVLAERSNQPTL